jgi:polysaccharide export outer membrane protein
MIICIFAFHKIVPMIKKIVAVTVLIVVLASCASRDKIRYFKGIEEAAYADSISYNPVLKQDDLLSIIVSSPSAEATANFNVASYGVGTTGATPGEVVEQPTYLSYLIDNEGYVEFPVLGPLKLAGLTRSSALSMIKGKLRNYIKEPFVTMRILNYKVSVQGEVARPGTFPIKTERVTLPEALAMAGDLTIYGRRDNVLIIRENEGKKTYNFVDLTKADFINSPFYYLSQNDMVYVEPNKVKMNSSAVGPNIAVILSALGILIGFYAIFTRN